MARRNRILDGAGLAGILPLLIASSDPPRRQSSWWYTVSVRTAWKAKGNASLLQLDLAGAFSRVHHGWLLAVLTEAGFAPELVRWLSGWLENRSAEMLVDGVATDGVATDGVATDVLISAGVPQGSAPIGYVTGPVSAFPPTPVRETTQARDCCHRLCGRHIPSRLRRPDPRRVVDGAHPCPSRQNGISNACPHTSGGIGVATAGGHSTVKSISYI